MKNTVAAKRMNPYLTTSEKPHHLLTCMSLMSSCSLSAEHKEDILKNSRVQTTTDFHCIDKENTDYLLWCSTDANQSYGFGVT